MTDAPKTIGLVHNGFGGWRLWTKDDADDPTVVAVPYILAAEHDRAESLQAQLAEARDKARSVADAYDRANPMRTADIHRDGCDCLRCAVDAIRAMKGERG